MTQKARRWTVLLLALLLVACENAAPAPTSAPAAGTTPEVTATLPPTAPPLPTPTVTQPPSPTPIPPTLTPTGTPEPAVVYPLLTLEPVDSVVRVFPGPVHYEGDRLFVEIQLGQYVEPQEGPVAVQLNRQDPLEITSSWFGNRLRVPLDTSGMSGSYQVTISGTHDTVELEESFVLELAPAAERPAQEENPAWATRTIECCVLHYITDTAAARDIEWIAETVQEAAGEFDQLPGVDIDETIDIFFIDRMWGNGGFGGNGELLAVYTDRLYGPLRGEEGLKTVVRHELGHAVDFDTPFFRLSEGLSVFLAGGHYKPEPLPQRAAAMAELNYYTSSGGPQIQHEIIYLHQAAQISYIVETYGWEGLWAYAAADSGEPVAALEQQDEALQATLGITREQFYEAYAAWLRDRDPGEQVRDLQLTVRLQDIRRDYQQRYAPVPDFLLGFSEDTFARPEFIHANIREPRAPANVATELLMANAQQAIIDGRYDAAARLIQAVRAVVDSGRLAHPLAREYGAIVTTLAWHGYEAVSLTLEEGRATVEATLSPPELNRLTLERSAGVWEITAADGPIPEPVTPSASSPLPTATPTREDGAAAPAEDPTPPEGALYFDDFSDPDSGWYTRSEEKVEIEYDAGAYRIWINHPNGFYWFEVEETFGDVTVETGVTLQGGPEINRFGLICNYDPDSGAMIQLLIDGRGRYGILGREDGIPEFFGHSGMEANEAIRPAGEPNLLRAVCAEDRVTFFANGVELATVENVASGGRTGFALGTSGGPGIDVVFDYLLVTEP